MGIARTFQTLRLYRNLTAIENVLAGMHLRRRDDTLQQLIPIAPFLKEDRRRWQQARELLARVGLDPDKFGNRQAAEFIPAPGISTSRLIEAAELSSLADDTPEGKSIVALARRLGSSNGADRDRKGLDGRVVPHQHG